MKKKCLQIIFIYPLLKSFRDHFEKIAKKYVSEFKLSSNKSYIIDIGSNGGSASNPLET